MVLNSLFRKLTKFVGFYKSGGLCGGTALSVSRLLRSISTTVRLFSNEDVICIRNLYPVSLQKKKRTTGIITGEEEEGEEEQEEQEEEQED